jgi:cell division protein FtsQ
LVGIGLSVTALYGLYWLEQSSFFRVQQVTVVGNHHESTAHIVALSGVGAHPTMFGLSEDSLQRNLSPLPWIRRVKLVKSWPHHITLVVTETSPVGVVAKDAGWVYVDVRGRNLGPAPQNADLPTIVAESKDQWPFATTARVGVIVASRLPAAFSHQVATISVDRHRNVTLQLTTPLRFFLGPATNLTAEFQAVAATIAGATLRPGDLVDVTVPDSPVISGPAPK